MNDRHLLANCITLLYCASQLKTHSENFKNLAVEIANNIKLSETSIATNNETKILAALRTSIGYFASFKDDYVIKADDLLQRIKLDTYDDTDLFDAIERGVIAGLSEDQYKERALSINRQLTDYIRDRKVEEIISKAQYKLKFDRAKITNMKHFVSEICTQLEPYQNNVSIEKDPAIIDEVDFSKVETLVNVFNTIEQMQSGEMIWKTGYQGLNRMLRGGPRRGDEIVIGALQHNYKTGFSLTLFRQLCTYNTPYMIDPTKKPLIVRMSFEDGVDSNIDFLYNSIKQNEHRRVDDFSTGVSAEEKALYIKSALEKTGFHVKMLRVDPGQWSYRDICNKIIEYELEGYEVQLLMLDYLAQVPTTGCTEGPMGSDIRDMFRRMRNFCNPRKITLITPHQLSTDAKMLIRDGRENFVQELVGKGYYDKCKTIDNEVDIEIFVHIVKVNGKAYLTLQRGKHRLNGQTPEQDLYFAIEYLPGGVILDDVESSDTSRRKPGGAPLGGQEKPAYWDFE